MTAVSTVTVDADGDERGLMPCVRTKANDGDSPRSASEAPRLSLTRPTGRRSRPRLRALLANGRVVTHDADRSLAVLAAEGVRLEQASLDTAELASILVPATGGDRSRYAREALGIISSTRDSQRMPQTLSPMCFEALLARIAAYDDVTLERLAAHISKAAGSSRTCSSREPRLASAPAEQPRLMPPEIAFLRERPREDALEPTGSLEPLDQRVGARVIGPHGTLSEVIAGFERRLQQEQMAEAVTDAINVNGQILVEAGRGPGKSLAYLVPAALSATERGETVVLSTNTLALQDQLLRKDVPDLIAALAKS